MARYCQKMFVLVDIADGPNAEVSVEYARRKLDELLQNPMLQILLAQQGVSGFVGARTEGAMYMVAPNTQLPPTQR